MKSTSVRLLIWAVVSSHVLAQAPRLATVYVAEQGATTKAKLGGFAAGGLFGLAATSSGNRSDLQASVKNLRLLLASNAVVKLVNKKESADIIVTIVDRGVGPDRFAGRTKDGQYSNVELTTTPVPEKTYWLSAVAQVGQKQRELLGLYTVTGQDSGRTGWDAAESGVVEELLKLTTVNTSHSVEANQKPPTTPATPTSATVPIPLTASMPVNASNSQPLSNKDVSDLAQAGLSDEVIVLKIKSGPTAFDTSTDGLIELKKSGVSDRVIATMLATK